MAVDPLVCLEELRTTIGSRAQRMDHEPEALRWTLDLLAERHLLALKRPEEYGGPAVGEEQFRAFQEAIARISGALAFLQTQHQSAVSLIARSENAELKQTYLPKMHDGEKLVGIGFSQLRRSGPPMVTAEPVEGGYSISGTVPWVTGWDFYPEFLVGASLPDGRAVFGIVPLTSQVGVSVSEPMHLAAMTSANTVSVQFADYLLRDSLVALIQPAGWIQRNDMINVALQGMFAMGCAQASLDIVLANATKKDLPFLHQAYRQLSSELEECREATRRAQAAANEETTTERLSVRAWAIDLAVRCGHAAVTSSSGAANSVDHPAQRVFREAMVFTVSAQTGPIMEATLERLARR